MIIHKAEKKIKKIVFILLFIPVFAAAQTHDVFIQLDDIKGDVIKVGFEGSLQALTFTPVGTNNAEFEFTMNVCTASGILKNIRARNRFIVRGKIIGTTEFIYPTMN